MNLIIYTACLFSSLIFKYQEIRLPVIPIEGLIGCISLEDTHLRDELRFKLPTPALCPVPAYISSHSVKRITFQSFTARIVGHTTRDIFSAFNQ